MRPAVALACRGRTLLLRDLQHLREARAALGDLSRRFLAMRSSGRTSPALADGHAGFALVHAGLDAAFPGAGHAAASERALERAIDGLATTTLPPSLFNGFVGVAWVTEFLSGHPPTAAIANDRCRPIDDALRVHLDKSPWKGPYDLCKGLVGIGIYALERLPRPSARQLLGMVVARLESAARPRHPGLAWWSDPHWVHKRNRRTPHLSWNLGLAHGVPGVIGLLGRVAGADVSLATRRRARTLLEASVAWLFAQELPPDAEGSFASAVGRSIPREPARLAWCYGDLGVAAALLVAGRAAGEPSWETAAVRISLRAATRPEGASGVVNAGLCHGAAGVAHIFHRLFLATREERLARAARLWFHRTLTMRDARGFGGFRAYSIESKEKPGWRADPTFLMGAAGVALALLAATSDVEPAWDRGMLLSDLASRASANDSTQAQSGAAAG